MEKEKDDLSFGEVNISDDVLGTIAGIATLEIEGIAGMSGGITGSIEKMLGRKNLSKGVKIEVKDDTTNIDLYIIVKYGYKIPEVAWKAQESVKKEVEAMTGLIIGEININVQGVEIESKKEDEKEANI